MSTTGLTPPTILEPSANSVYIGLSATIEMVSRITTALLLSELKKSLGDEAIKSHLKDGISSYLYVAGFLSLTGKEINRENIISCLASLGIKAKDELIEAMFRANIKSHLVYVYAYYFLLSVGRDITVEDIISVLKAIGVPEDRAAAAEAIAFLNKQLGMEKEK